MEDGMSEKKPIKDIKGKKEAEKEPLSDEQLDKVVGGVSGGTAGLGGAAIHLPPKK
jgi:hypothetical protein